MNGQPDGSGGSAHLEIWKSNASSGYRLRKRRIELVDVRIPPINTKMCKFHINSIDIVIER